jgi:hypothetical protein
MGARSACCVFRRVRKIAFDARNPHGARHSCAAFFAQMRHGSGALLCSRVCLRFRSFSSEMILVTAVLSPKSTSSFFACLRPSRVASLPLLTAPNRRRAHGARGPPVQAGQGLEPAGRPLTRLGWQKTIETRFCVNRMVTKTDPKRLGGLSKGRS